MSDRVITDRHRLIRVLEYTGTKPWLESCLVNRAVKEEFRTPGGNGIIREGIVGRSMSLVEPEVGYEEAYAKIQDAMNGDTFPSQDKSADDVLDWLKQAGFRLTRL